MEYWNCPIPSADYSKKSYLTHSGVARRETVEKQVSRQIMCMCITSTFLTDADVVGAHWKMKNRPCLKTAFIGNVGGYSCCPVAGVLLSHFAHQDWHVEKGKEIWLKKIKNVRRIILQRNFRVFRQQLHQKRNSEVSLWLFVIDNRYLTDCWPTQTEHPLWLLPTLELYSIPK